MPYIISLLLMVLLAACSSDAQKTDDTSKGNITGQYYRPTLQDIWQYQLSGTLNLKTNATVYDIDLFDSKAETIKKMHDQGLRVICYFSAGSSENWRSDFSSFKNTDMGNPLDPVWVGEKWLDIRSENVKTIMKKRLDLARQKGCDAVEADNVDGYTNKPGFDFNASDQLDYNRFLAKEAHQRGLGIALKNDLLQVKDLVNDFDFSVNEQCHEMQECSYLQPFITQNKAVFNVEYHAKYQDANTRHQLCVTAAKEQFSTLYLPLMLDGSWRYSCQEEMP